MKETGLIIIGGVVLLILYFYTENKNQSTQANTSGLNNSFPTFNLLYPISSSVWTGTSTYSGLSGGMPIMYEAPQNPVYYGGGSYGNTGFYTPDASGLGQIGQFLGAQFGG